MNFVNNIIKKIGLISDGAGKKKTGMYSTFEMDYNMTATWVLSFLNEVIGFCWSN